MPSRLREDGGGAPPPAGTDDAVAAATEHVAAEVVRDVAPKVLFFFSAFMILFLIFTLFVAHYSIELFAFTRAAVAALVLGKVIPLLDWAESGYRFERHRRIVVVLGRTLAYALVVIVLGTAERMFTAYRHEGSLDAAIHFVVANADIHRFLGLVLLLSLVVGPYLTMQEIDRAIGEGVLFRVLFRGPAAQDADDPLLLSGAAAPSAATRSPGTPADTPS